MFALYLIHGRTSSAHIKGGQGILDRGVILKDELGAQNSSTILFSFRLKYLRTMQLEHDGRVECRNEKMVEW